MGLPGSEPFFLFVTGGFGDRELVGESKVIQGHDNLECDHFEIYLLNSLVPSVDMQLPLASCKSFACHTSEKQGGAAVVNFAAAVRTAASTNRDWNTDTTTHPRFRSTSGITCTDNAVLTRLRAMWVMEPWSLR